MSKYKWKKKRANNRAEENYSISNLAIPGAETASSHYSPVSMNFENHYYRGNAIQELYDGISESQAIGSIIQSVVNAYDPNNYDLHDASNALVNTIRNVVLAMRNNGEI